MERLRDKELANRLNEEMDAVVFNEEMKAAVLRKAAMKPSFWNRELTIPVPAIVAVAVFICAVPLVCWHQIQSYRLSGEQSSASESQVEQRQKLVVSSAGVFYESQLSNRGPKHDSN